MSYEATSPNAAGQAVRVTAKSESSCEAHLLRASTGSFL